MLNNGTVVVGSHDSTGFYLQVAPHWRGPYTRVPGYQFLFPSTDRGVGYVFEDPFLWFDAAAKRWRCLVHEYTLAKGGHHLGGVAVSLTEDILGPWRLQSWATPAYTLAANDTAGGSVSFARRERPKLLLSAQGKLGALPHARRVACGVWRVARGTWPAARHQARADHCFVPMSVRQANQRCSTRPCARAPPREMASATHTHSPSCRGSEPHAEAAGRSIKSQRGHMQRLALAR